MFGYVFAVFAALSVFILAGPANAAPDAQNILVMSLAQGQVEIEMRPDLAPKHVARIKELVGKKFYDGVVFHRVIEGFMAQTGDPTGTGAGGSGVKLAAEFTAQPHKRAIVSMARATDPNSADSQFFIMLADNSHLDGRYTVWGQVVSGMEFVDLIRKGDKNNNGIVVNPDKIVSLRLKNDLK